MKFSHFTVLTCISNLLVFMAADQRSVWPLICLDVTHMSGDYSNVLYFYMAIESDLQCLWKGLSEEKGENLDFLSP